MKKNNFGKIKAIILVIFLIIVALVSSLLIFKFIDLIYKNFNIIPSMLITDPENGETFEIYILGYFQIVFSLIIGALIGRFIFLRASNKNFNSKKS